MVFPSITARICEEIERHRDKLDDSPFLELKVEVQDSTVVMIVITTKHKPKAR